MHLLTTLTVHVAYLILIIQEPNLTLLGIDSNNSQERGKQKGKETENTD